MNFIIKYAPLSSFYFSLLSKSLLSLSLIVFLGCSDRDPNPNFSGHSGEESEVTSSDQNLNNNNSLQNITSNAISLSSLIEWRDFLEEMAAFYDTNINGNMFIMLSREDCATIVDGIIQLIEESAGHISDSNHIDVDVDNFKTEFNRLKSEWDVCSEDLDLAEIISSVGSSDLSETSEMLAKILLVTIYYSQEERSPQQHESVLYTLRAQRGFIPLIPNVERREFLAEHLDFVESVFIANNFICLNWMYYDPRFSLLQRWDKPLLQGKVGIEEIRQAFYTLKTEWDECVEENSNQ